jgi:hypothetical protein
VFKMLKGLLAFAAATLALGLLPDAVCADGCFKTRSYFGAYSYAPTYAAPTYYYQQPYYVPKVVEAIVAPDYYYSVGSYYKDKLLADAIVGRIAELQLKNPGGQTAPPTYSPGPEAAPPGGGVRQAPANPMSPLNTPQIEVIPQQGRRGPGAYQNPKLLAVLNQACASCHGDTPTRGASWTLVSQGKLANLTSAEWNEAFVLVSTQEMPKGNKPVADEATVLFREAALAVRQLEASARK